MVPTASCSPSSSGERDAHDAARPQTRTPLAACASTRVWRLHRTKFRTYCHVEGPFAKQPFARQGILFGLREGFGVQPVKAGRLKG